MQNSIQNCRGNDSVVEYASPFSHCAVTRQQHAPAFVAPRDELEEQVSRFRFEGQVPELVDDEQLRLSVVSQPLVKSPLAVSLHQVRA